MLPIRGDGIFLALALRSLAWQAAPVDELIVVDDGMGENAHALLRDRPAGLERLITVAGAGAGPAAARNKGLAVATGELIAFIDDDDVWPKDKLARQLAFLGAHPDAEAVGGKIRWFSEWDAATEAPAETADLRDVVHVNLGAYVFRRSVFERLGQFDPSLTFSEDVDFILRMADHEVRFSILEAVTLHYRRHARSMTALRSEKEKVDYRKVLFRSLGRNRDRRAEGLRSLSARLVTDREADGSARD